MEVWVYIVIELGIESGHPTCRVEGVFTDPLKAEEARKASAVSWPDCFVWHAHVDFVPEVAGANV